MLFRSPVRIDATAIVSRRARRGSIPTLRACWSPSKKAFSGLIVSAESARPPRTTGAKILSWFPVTPEKLPKVQDRYAWIASGVAY